MTKFSSLELKGKLIEELIFVYVFIYVGDW